MNVRVSALALAAGLSLPFLAACGRTDAAKVVRGGDPGARPVRLVRAESRPMTRAIAVTGSLSAQERSTLSAKVAGRLHNLAVDVGSVVHQGDLLAQIEPLDYELQLKQSAAALGQARASLGLPPEGDQDQVDLHQVSSVKQAKAVLEEATKNRDRIRELSTSGIAAEAELDTVEANFTVARSRYETALEDARTRVAALAQSRAAYEIALKQLNDASTYAPFDGTIQARIASLGEYVAVGTPIVQLVKTDPLRLRLQVPERESTLVRPGQLTRLLVEGDTNVYTGSISRISPALDEQSRMLLVEADVPCHGSLRPGLFARAQIIISETENGLSVPPEAIVTFAGIEKVIMVQDGKALEKTVTTGRRGADWVEILTGLNPGDEVVSDVQGLKTGQPVAISGSGPDAASVQANKETSRRQTATN